MTNQAPVVDKIEENETNLYYFLPNVVVEKEAGVPKSNRDKSQIMIFDLFKMKFSNESKSKFINSVDLI